MKTPRASRAILGIVLCVGGFILGQGGPVRQTTVIVDAGGCRMVTDVIDLGQDETQGSVVLFHGLAANKKIMAYLAQGFALQHLRVFVPDLPGHGRTPGPFSFARSAACAESFTLQLIARGAIDPARTIVAGHSMGGAIAVLVAARIPVAATIAISPAPMTAARGMPSFMLPFDNPPSTSANTLAISGAWELGSIRDTAHDLADGSAGGTGKFLLVPGSTHVSVLFDTRVVRAAQEWAAQALHLPATSAVPGYGPVFGSVLGLIGILLLAGPFIRETLNEGSRPTFATEPSGSAATLRTQAAWAAEALPVSLRASQVAAASLLAVGLLRFGNPLRFVRVFEGDYLAAFLLLVGASLLLLHHKEIASAVDVSWICLASAAMAGLIVHLLVMGWLELTLTETWVTQARWLRFPVLVAVVLPYHFAEELLLGPTAQPAAKHLARALLFRLLAWGALVAGIFVLHSGEILLVLLAPYFALFCVLQRAGMTVVRKGTGSPVAAAIFGAILLAGFCLVVFPIT